MKTLEKRQKSRVGVAGSFINQMMGNNATLPEVGKGATELHYTDRTCYEVIEVSKDGKTVKLEALDAEWDQTKPNGMGHQNWILKPTGRFKTVVWRNGAWRLIVKKIIYVDGYYKAFEARAEEVGRNQARQEMMVDLFDDETCSLKLVEGKTREQITYPVIKLLFGTKDYYHDWSF